MSVKSPGYVWLTFLGQGLYETLNPYWDYCEGGGVLPEWIVILHPPMMNKEKDRAVDAFSILTEEYFKNGRARVDGVSFDPGNISSFAKRAEAVFRDAAARSWMLMIDISPTTWSFVPGHLTKIAGAHNKRVKSIIYLQYSNPAHRKRPYPLIPGLGITAHDLFTDLV